MQANSALLRQVDFGYFADKALRFLARLLASFQVHAILFVLVGAFVALTYAVQGHIGGTVDLDPLAVLQGKISTLIMPLMLIGIFFTRLFKMIVWVRPEHPLPYLIKDIGGFFLKPARLLYAIPTTIAVIYFVECYTTIKDAISFIQPFSWDVAFMQLDRSLHFGVDPWRLLQPVFGYAWVTTVLNFFYNVWFLVLWFVLVTLAFSEKHLELRLQYFVAFLLCWMIGGSVMAMYFSSAGPAFYGYLGLGPDPFAPLMDYLRQANEIGYVPALTTQGMLWEAYQNGNKGMVSGISAMPSMHNSTAVLLALLGWRVSRFAGIAGSIFAALVLIGSVHLGWHYAIDGYVGIALAFGVWWYSGLLVRWYLALPFIKRNIEIVHQDERDFEPLALR